MKEGSLCAICGGAMIRGTTTFSADLGTGVVVVRRVRALVCNQCGEEWIDDATAAQLEAIVADARRKRHEVEVTALT
ncbi:MAG: type II toxin-antitoxin system MqsA family antitoxin [Spirochaetales bacterium]|nr:type II toxin-antitoxin system MqsA family antitoxin [Spirochaetales bacterium]